MEGIGEVLGFSTHEIVMINYLYELDAYCTSIIAKMSNNTVFLARNLDFYFPEETRKVLYNAHFYRGSKFLFEAPMFAGIIGIFTAHRPYAFALSINERTEKKSAADFFKNLLLLITGYGQISILARETMTNC